MGRIGEGLRAIRTTSIGSLVMMVCSPDHYDEGNLAKLIRQHFPYVSAHRPLSVKRNSACSHNPNHGSKIYNTELQCDQNIPSLKQNSNVCDDQ